MNALPMRYYLGPPALTSAIVSVGIGMIAFGQSWNIPTFSGAGAIAGLLYGWGIVTPGYLKMIGYKEYRQEVKAVAKPDEFIMRAEIEKNGYRQVDFFRGLTPDQWRKCAVSIASVKNFTVMTVGQVERPKLLPMMLAAEYVESVGGGQYKLTDDGLCWWMSLAQSPYPWKVVPKKIATLSMDAIYTSYTRARGVVS